MKIANQPSFRSAQSTKYLAPKLDRLSGNAFTSGSPTNGGMTINLEGDYFGPTGSNSISAFYGPSGNTKKYEARNCQVLGGANEHNVIQCTTNVGVGADLFWVVSVGDQESSISISPYMSSYAIPTISGLGGAAASQFGSTTEGNIKMVLSGSNFGPAGTPVSAVYGPDGEPSKYTARDCSVLGHTRVECFTVEGTGGLLRWRVTSGGQVSVVFEDETMKYSNPSITTVPNTRINTDGTSTLVLDGDNFGQECSGCVFASYGGSQGTLYGIVQCSVTSSHHQLVCNTEPGVGINHRWKVTRDSLTSELSSGSTSYMIPTIDSNGLSGAATASNGSNTRGGVGITISGSNFGPAGSADVIVKYGPLGNLELYTATNCVVSGGGHTIINCQTGAGVGDKVFWTVYIDGQMSIESIQHTSYMEPIFTSIGGEGVSSLSPTTGGLSVSLTGDYFGPPGSAYLHVYFGPDSHLERFKAQDCKVPNSAPHIRIDCKTSQGIGQNLKWSVRIGHATEAALKTLHTNLASSLTSFASPLITDISGPGAAVSGTQTNGGIEVILLGSNFGPGYDALNRSSTFSLNFPVSSYSNASYGPRGDRNRYQPLCAVTSHTRATCRTVAGVGGGFKWRINIGGQDSPIFDDIVTKYADPEISGLQIPANEMNTLGCSLDDEDCVVLEGRNFGPECSDFCATATYGGIAGTKYGPILCQVTSAHVEMKCNTLPGIGKDHFWKVKRENLTSALSSSSSRYALPQITELLASLGTVTVSISDGAATVTHDNHETVMAKLGDSVFLYGYGTSLVGPFSVIGHPNLTAMQLDVASTGLSGYKGVGEAAIVIDPDFNGIPTTGNTRIRIRGSSFGPPPHTQIRARYGYTEQTLDYGATSCSVIHQSVSHSEAVCHTVPGVGSDLLWRVTIAEQHSSLSTMGMRYAPPVLLKSTSSAGKNVLGVSPLGETQGGANMTFFGSQFGPSGHQEIHVRYGSNLHENDSGAYVMTSCIVSGHTTLSCKVPEGVGKNLLFQLIVGLQKSEIDPINGVKGRYARPNISNFVGASSMETVGGQTYTIHGSNFGPLSPLNPVSGGISNGIYLPALKCSVKIEHTAISCTTPMGEGIAFRWKVVVGAQESNFSKGLVDYTPPSVILVDPNNGLRSGDTQITVFGTNFGLNPSVYVAGYECRNSVYDQSGDHTSIRCLTPPSSQNKSFIDQVSLRSGSQNSTNSSMFAYTQVTSLSPLLGCVDGGTEIKISGNSFVETSYIGIRFDGWSQDSQGLFVNNNSISALSQPSTTPRIVSAISVTLNQQQYETIDENRFEYYPVPIVAEAPLPRAGPSTGDSKIHFVGQFFNTSVVSARFGNQVTVNCSLVNTSYAQCSTPPISSVRDASYIGGEVFAEISVDPETSAGLCYSKNNFTYYYYPTKPSMAGTAPRIIDTSSTEMSDLINISMVIDVADIREFYRREGRDLPVELNLGQNKVDFVEHSVWKATVPLTLNNHIGTEHAKLALNMSSWFSEASECGETLSVWQVSASGALVELPRYILPDTCNTNMTVFWVRIDPLVVAPSQHPLANVQSSSRRLQEHNETQIYVSNSKFATKESGDLSSVFYEFHSLREAPIAGKWLLPSDTAPLSWRFFNNSWQFRGQLDYAVGARLVNRILPSDFADYLAVEMQINEKDTTEGLMDCAKENIINDACSANTPFLYVSPFASAVLLPVSNPQNGLVSLRLNQNRSITLVCEAVSYTSKSNCTKSVTKLNTLMLSFRKKQVSASYGNCLISTKSECGLSPSFTNGGASIYLGSVDISHPTRWQSPGSAIFLRRSSSETSIAPLLSGMIRYEVSSPLSNLIGSGDLRVGLNGVSDDVALVEPTTNIFNFDSSNLELSPVTRGPVSGEFPIWIQGYPSAHAKYYNTKVRFTSIFSKKSFVVQCDAYIDSVGLRCDASIPQVSELEVGNTRVEVSLMGQHDYYTVNTPFTMYSVSSTLVSPTCAKIGVNGLFMKVSSKLYPSSVEEIQMRSARAPAITLQKTSTLSTDLVQIGNATSGDIIYRLPSDISAGKYYILISFFPNQTAYLQTQFLVYNHIVEQSAMQLTPLISPASRSGISSSFSRLWLKGNHFEELMNPVLIFRDVVTQENHTTIGDSVSVFKMFQGRYPLIPEDYSESIFLNESLQYVKLRTLLLPEDFVNAKVDQSVSHSRISLSVDIPGDGTFFSIEFRYANLQGRIPEFSSDSDKEAYHRNLLSAGAPQFHSIEGPSFLGMTSIPRGASIDLTGDFVWNGGAVLIEMQRVALQVHESSARTKTFGKLKKYETLFSRSISYSETFSDRRSGNNPTTSIAWDSFHTFIPALTLKSARNSQLIVFTLPGTMALDASKEKKTFEVLCSLDNGQTTIPGKEWKFTLLSSRTEISIIRPSTGPVTGGTVISMYGIMFPNIPEHYYKVRWDISVNIPYSRTFFLYTGAEREPYGVGSAYLNVITPYLPRPEILMKGLNSLRVSVDISTNEGELFSRNDLRRGRAKIFEFQPEVILLNATCISQDCIDSHIIPEKGGVDIKIFAENIFYSAGLLMCRLIQVESHGTPDLTLKTPNTRVFAEFPANMRGYRKSGTFTCRAKAHPRGKVKLEITTNGQQFVGAGSTAILIQTTFTYVGCPTGYVAPFYYRSCAVCSAGKYAGADGKTCILCGLHTYTDVNASLTCKSCPQNSRTVVLGAASRVQCQCVKDTFALNYSALECKACPSFANCTGGWDTPKPLRGFWRTPNCSSRIACKNSFLLCRPRLACPGLPENNCTAGYTGPLCGKCAKGYFRLNQMCQECPQSLNIHIGGWWKLDPLNLALISLSSLVFVLVCFMFVGFGCIAKTAQPGKALAGVFLSMFSAIALVSFFVVGLGYIPIYLNSLLMVQLALTFLILTIVFFFGLMVTKLGSFFLLVHFTQLLYMCSRYEMPWPPWFSSFFRFLGDFAMPLILYPSFVETVATKCSPQNITWSPIQEFSIHMMGLPASLAMVSLIYIFALTSRVLLITFVQTHCCGWYCSTSTAPLLRSKYNRKQCIIHCGKRKLHCYNNRNSETESLKIEQGHPYLKESVCRKVILLSSEDSRRLFNTLFVVVELNLIFMLTATTSPSRCTLHNDGISRYDGWPSEKCVEGSTVQKISIFYCIFFVLGLTLLQAMAGLKVGQFSSFAKRFRKGAKHWYIIVTTRSILFVYTAVFLDKMFQLHVNSIPVLQAGLSMVFIVVNTALHLAFQPYKDRSTNSAGIMLLSSVFTTIFIGLLFFTQMFPNTFVEDVYDLLAFCLLMIALLYALIVVGLSARDRWYVQMEKSKIRKRLTGRHISDSTQHQLDKAPRFIFHLLNRLLYKAGGDIIPLSNIRVILSKHSSLQRDLVYIMRSVIISILTEKRSSLYRRAEVKFQETHPNWSRNGEYSYTLKEGTFRSEKRLPLFLEICQVIVFAIWSVLLFVGGLNSDDRSDFLMIAFYIPRWILQVTVLIILCRYFAFIKPNVTKALFCLQDSLRVPWYGKLIWSSHFSAATAVKCMKFCRCCKICTGIIERINFMISSIVALVGFLIWAASTIAIGLLHTALHVILKPLAAWGMEPAFSFVHQAWFALLMIGLATMVMQSLRTWEILILGSDAFVCLIIPVYGQYADHRHLDELFWHMKRELWKEGVLSSSEVVESEGLSASLKMLIEIIFQRLLENFKHLRKFGKMSGCKNCITLCCKQRQRKIGNKQTAVPSSHVQGDVEMTISNPVSQKCQIGHRVIVDHFGSGTIVSQSNEGSPKNTLTIQLDWRLANGKSTIAFVQEHKIRKFYSGRSSASSTRVSMVNKSANPSKDEQISDHSRRISSVRWQSAFAHARLTAVETKYRESGMETKHNRRTDSSLHILQKEGNGSKRLSVARWRAAIAHAKLTAVTAQVTKDQINAAAHTRKEKKSITQHHHSGHDGQTLLDPAYFGSPEDVEDIKSLFECANGSIEFMRIDHMLTWIYSPRQPRHLIDRLREGIVQIIEEDRNSAESSQCHLVRTAIERNDEVIDSCCGDHDVLCSDGDKIKYYVAVCDRSGKLLEQPSVRTTIEVFSIPRETKNRCRSRCPLLLNSGSLIKMKSQVNFFNTHLTTKLSGTDRASSKDNQYDIELEYNACVTFFAPVYRPSSDMHRAVNLQNIVIRVNSGEVQRKGNPAERVLAVQPYVTGLKSSGMGALGANDIKFSSVSSDKDMVSDNILNKILQNEKQAGDHKDSASDFTMNSVHQVRAGEHLSVHFAFSGSMRGIGTWRYYDMSLKPAKNHKLSAPSVKVKILRKKSSSSLSLPELPVFGSCLPAGSRVFRARMNYHVEATGHVQSKFQCPRAGMRSKMKTIIESSPSKVENETHIENVNGKQAMDGGISNGITNDIIEDQDISATIHRSRNVLRKPHIPTQKVYRVISCTARIGGTISGDYNVFIYFDGKMVANPSLKVIPLEVDESKSSVVALKFIRPDMKVKSVHRDASNCGKRFLIVLRDRYWNVLYPGTFASSVHPTIFKCSVKSTTPGLQHIKSELHVEALSKPFSNEEKTRADFRPSNIDEISEECRSVGLTRCRLAAMQITKERKLIEKLLNPVPFQKLFSSSLVDYDNDSRSTSKRSRSVLPCKSERKHAVKKLIKCPLVDKQNYHNIEFLGVPHPSMKFLSMESVLLVTRYPLRGIGSNSKENIEKWRPSILLDRNSHIWFPYCSGTYIADLTLETVSTANTKIQQSTKLISFPVHIKLKTETFSAKTKKAPFGTLDWVCMHKVLKNARLIHRDVFALEVWPKLLHDAFLKNLASLPISSTSVSEEELSRLAWPHEFSLLHGFVDSSHTEAILYVFKSYIYRMQWSADANLTKFIEGFVRVSRRIDMLDNKTGLLSKIAWPEDAQHGRRDNKTDRGALFNSTTKMMNLLKSMTRILHKKRMSMQTDMEFMEWWKISGNSSASLATLVDNWTPVPPQITHFVNDIITKLEMGEVSNMATAATERVLSVMCERFVDEGLKYMMNLCSLERIRYSGSNTSSKAHSVKLKQAPDHFSEEVVKTVVEEILLKVIHHGFCEENYSDSAALMAQTVVTSKANDTKESNTKKNETEVKSRSIYKKLRRHHSVPSLSNHISESKMKHTPRKSLRQHINESKMKSDSIKRAASTSKVHLSTRIGAGKMKG